MSNWKWRKAAPVHRGVDEHIGEYGNYYPSAFLCAPRRIIVNGKALLRTDDPVTCKKCLAKGGAK